MNRTFLAFILLTLSLTLSAASSTDKLSALLDELEQNDKYTKTAFFTEKRSPETGQIQSVERNIQFSDRDNVYVKKLAKLIEELRPKCTKYNTYIYKQKTHYNLTIVDGDYVTEISLVPDSRYSWWWFKLTRKPAKKK